MERQSVTSSNVKSVGYDAQARVLEVEFQGGSVYQYEGVPVDVHAELMASPSIGRAVGTLIRGGGYAVTKLAPAPEPEDEDDEEESAEAPLGDEGLARRNDHRYGRGNW